MTDTSVKLELLKIADQLTAAAEFLRKQADSDTPPSEKSDQPFEYMTVKHSRWKDDDEDDD